MSDRDDISRPDVPEFVAVTPRGQRDEPAQEAGAQPDPDPAAETASDASDVPVAPAEAEADSPDEPAPATDQDPAAHDEPSSEASAAEDSSQPSPVRADAAEPGTAQTTDSPAPPAPTLQWRPPTLERPATPPEPVQSAEQATEIQSGPGAGQPEPRFGPAGEVEVSVRVAAEGMAAALAGGPSPLSEAEPRSRSVGPLAVATAVCVVLAIAAAVLLAVTARSQSDHREVALARAAALDAAKRQTAIALTYDYRQLDADFQRAEAGMSRRFRANYAETAAKSVAPLAKKTHAVTSGTVAAGGVVSATPDRVRVLIFANQVIENNLLNATSRLDRSVIEVTMIKEDGRWVIDNLQPF